MRNLWLRRNNFVFNQLLLSPNKIMNRARCEIVNFQSALDHPRQQKQTDNIKWTPPNVGVAKVN